MSQSGMDNACLGLIGRLVSQPRFPERGYKARVAICAAVILSFATPALAAIGSGSTALASGLGTGDIAFQGGTLKNRSGRHLRQQFHFAEFFERDNRKYD